MAVAGSLAIGGEKARLWRTTNASWMRRSNKADDSRMGWSCGWLVEEAKAEELVAVDA